MAVNDQRWHQLGDPVTAAEAQGLQALRDLLPDSPLTHAWTNVTFRDREGRASEIDVILLHHNGLHFLELKGWHGSISGDQMTWRVTAPNGNVRVDKDPFIATDGKAKRFGSELKHAAAQRGVRPNEVPRIRAATVLHGQGSTVSLSEQSAANTYGLDGYQVTGVRSIRVLLDAAPQNQGDVIDAQRAKALVALIKDLGLQATPKVRTVGQYVIDSADPLGEGPGWVDVRAQHPALHDEYRRIRMYDVPPKATANERHEIERMATREYALAKPLEHPGVARPLEVLTTEAGPALVFPDDSGQLPLTTYLTAHPLDADGRRALIRQVGEVVDYAHKRGVQHRALSPACVYVGVRDGAPRVQVRDWQTGRRDLQGGTTRNPTIYHGVSEVAGRVVQDALLYLAPEAHQPDPAGVPLDVYGLGVLSYLILTDAPPATNFAALKQRLELGGLDPAADRDGLPADMCALVREATNPDVVERTPSVAAFLDQLTLAATVDVDEPGPVADPRDAEVGDAISERWIVRARLGSGGSGVALLVDDADLGTEGLVLKVALDDSAADRIAAEAQVLEGLDHPRVVRCLDGPLDAAGHTAIVVEDAGRPTLGRRLLDEGRLTLEQLEGYGRDLFEAVAHLDANGVFHRDIKPDNLGVREARGDRTRHLVLFDFSLATEPLDKVRSGTHGYMDPFLGHGARRRYDSAAERFAVAATLFEMAAGTRPEWGDGQSDPALIPDEVHLAAGMFEPEVADGLIRFFRQALARDAAARFDDLAAMAQAWAAVFPSSQASTTQEATEAERDSAADAATPSTPLGQAGLTARAVSAARRIGAETVQELIDASAFDINRMPGVGVVVRSELQRRRRQWATRFAGTTSTIDDAAGVLLRGVESTQAALVPKGRSRAAAAAGLARRLLNLDLPEGAPTWPDHAAAAADALVATDPTGSLAALAAHWAKSPIVADLRGEVIDALAVLGGVATADELAERLVALRGSTAEGSDRRRNAVGLVRAVVEADAGESLALVRHGDQVLLTTTSGTPDERLEAAVALADSTDAALAAAAAGGTTGPLGPNVGLDLVRTHPRAGDLGIGDPQRALALAARASATAAVSSRSELYPRGMSAAAAVAAVLGATQSRITPDRLRALAGSRFPAALPAPDRPDLDPLVAAAAPALTWDADARVYVRKDSGSGSLLSTGTVYTPGVPVRFDEVHEALSASLASHAATVLTTGHHHLVAAPGALARRYGVTVVDVTAELIAAMRDRAGAAGVDWSLVLRADAAAPGSGDRANLERLVADATAQFWPALLARPEPLLLTDAAPLARYGQIDLLAALLDTATIRPAARWLLVPKRAGAPAPTLDGVAIPVASGTWIELPETQQASA